MASLTPTPKQQIYGSDGAPLVGGKIYTYSAGTTTPLATYTDSGAGTANTNPIILNSLGQANIWLSTSSYKFSVYTSADVLLYTVDNISAPLDSAGLATALSSPTPIGNTAPNTGAFTTLSATTGTITTVNATAVNATTVTPTTLTFAGGGSMTKPPESAIKPITATVSANALTVTLNPTTLDFRSATLTSGTVVSRVISSAISMTVSSGSTLGTVSTIQSRIVVLALDNAGTVELAVVNITGGNDLSETGLISTTAEGGAGAADSASVIYSTTARSNVAYRVVGYVESTQATAGTWATTPSTIQGQGGNALTGLPRMLVTTTVPTTSGTSITITSIPSWVCEIDVVMNLVSTNGTSGLLLQIGDAGGIETSGYVSAVSRTTSSASTTAGFYLIELVAAADTNSGVVSIKTLNPIGLTWTQSSNIAWSANSCATGAGAKTLTEKLTQVRLTTVNGTDAFDSGSISLILKGY